MNMLLIIKIIISAILITVFIPMVFITILSIIWSITSWRPCKKICHDNLGWHEPDTNTEHFKENDPLNVNLHATCKFCGKDIIQDSQGNWFI